MSRLAEIQNLIVTNIIIGETVDYPTFTDVTSIECNMGWIDNEDGTFSAPPPERINTITTDEFIDRIPQAAFETISNHSSAEAKTFMSLLNARSSIDLNNDKTTYYVDKMLVAGLITQQEHDDILA